MKVLDTSGILRSDLDFSGDRLLTTNEVLGEVQDETARIAVESAIKRGNIEVHEPRIRYVKEIRAMAKETGDLERLSDTDLGVLALALEKNLAVITDDYNMQNVASALNLRYEKGCHEGIKRRLMWFNVCEGCGRKYPNKSLVCDVCGSYLKRKSVRI